MINIEQFIDHHKHRMSIDPSNKCALKCPLCLRSTQYGKEKIKAGGDITLTDLKKVMDYSSHIKLCGQISDVIYHPQYTQMVQMFNDTYSDVSIHVATNGHGKTIEWWKDVFSKSDSIVYVFGADDIENTSEMYRVNQDFAKVWEVMKMGAEMGIVVVWQFILLDHNEKYLEQAMKMASNNGIYFQIVTSPRNGFTIKYDSKIIHEPKIKYHSKGNEWQSLIK